LKKTRKIKGYSHADHIWPRPVSGLLLCEQSPKWKLGLGDDLMDEVLCEFGSVEMAKGRWLVIMKIGGSHYPCTSSFLFLFLCCFVICRLWVLVCVLTWFGRCSILIDLVFCGVFWTLCTMKGFQERCKGGSFRYEEAKFFWLTLCFGCKDWDAKFHCLCLSSRTFRICLPVGPMGWMLDG
jgi:hypothetical protein